jgi:pre-mRNA-processing factor 6
METNDEKARELLQRAISCCPHSMEFWISLARLETSAETAQKRLNEARKNFPGEIRIWITAVRLVEETTNSIPVALAKISEILSKALERIAAHVDRTTWLKQAEECEDESFPVTCEAIIRVCLGYSVDPVDRQRTWLADASQFEKKGHVLCCRCCFDLLLQDFSDDEDVWLERISFERRLGQSKDVNSSALALVEVLRKACTHVPDSQLLWLMYAKEVWVSGDLNQARQILDQAFEKLKDSAGEEMWFAAAKLAQEVSVEEAREVYRKARESCPDSERVWVKSIVFERKVLDEQKSKEQQLARDALQRFPKSEKLWLMLGQYLEWKYAGDLGEAKQVYQNGIDACASGSKNGGSFKLWLALARVEEQMNSSKVTARAILANARGRFPTQSEVWLASIRLERRAGEPISVVDSLLARGLQAIPNDGLLLSEQIEIAPEAKKESISKDAFEKTQGKDSKVILAVARVWWRKRPLDAKKVKKWLERSVSLGPKFGDAWAAMLRFHKDEQDSEDIIKAVVARCVRAAPTHGERWIRISKCRGNEDLKTEDILTRVAASSEPDDYVF